MQKPIVVLSFLVALLQSACSVVGIQNEETPTYKVLESEDNIEVRVYEPYLVAETTVKGDYDEAQNLAFRKLAKYIFGDNKGDQKIAMTVPVQQRQAKLPESQLESANPDFEKDKNKGKSIPMTAPVMQTPAGDGYTMMFMMPHTYTLASLPEPLDHEVRLREMPRKTYAVITYGWYDSENRNQRLTNDLRRWLKTKTKYKEVSSPPIYAGYNPPWTLPFFRKNEIMIEIELR